MNRRIQMRVSILADLLGILGGVALLGTFIAAVVALAVSWAKDSRGWYLAFLALASVLAILVIALLAWIHRLYTSHELENGYRWVSAEYRYEINAAVPHFHTQTVLVNVRALRNGVSVFTNQYQWTGAGVDQGPTLESGGHRLLGTTEVSSGWTSYRVAIAPPMIRGEETLIRVRQDLVDDKRQFQPFVAKTVQQRLDALVLKVLLPPGQELVSAWRVTRRGFGPGARVISRESINLAAFAGSLEFDVAEPIVGNNYEICWSYADGKGLYA